MQLDEVGRVHVPYYVPDGKVTNGVQPITSVHIRFVRTIKPQAVQAYAKGQGTPKLWDSTPEARAMNIILSKCFTSDGAVISGRNEFFPSGPEKH